MTNLDGGDGDGRWSRPEHNTKTKQNMESNLSRSLKPRGYLLQNTRAAQIAHRDFPDATQPV